MCQHQRVCPRRPLIELRYPLFYYYSCIVRSSISSIPVVVWIAMITSPSTTGWFGKYPRDTFPAPHRKDDPLLQYYALSAFVPLGNPRPGVQVHALSAWCKYLILVTKMSAELRRCLRSSIQRTCWGCSESTGILERALHPAPRTAVAPDIYRWTYVVCDVLLRKRTEHAKDTIMGYNKGQQTDNRII